MRSRSLQWTALFALLPMLAAPVLAQPSIPGAEQRVSQLLTKNQHHPAAAFLASGASLVVWENELIGLQGRRFGRDGAVIGEELTLVANNNLSSVPGEGEVTLRKNPAVVGLPAGGYLLTWTEERGFLRVDFFISNYEVRSQQIFGQLFTGTGQPVGDRFRVSTGPGFHRLPQVVVRGEDVAVAWNLDDQANQGDRGVLMRRFDLGGRSVSSQVRVSPEGVAATGAALATDRNGRLLVAWQAPDGNNQGIFAQIYNRAGDPSGSSFRVNTRTAGLQARPAVASNGGDAFLVLWNSQPPRSERVRILGQVVGAAGNLIGGEVNVSSGTVEKEVVPALAAGRNGRFLAAWLGYRQVFPTGVYAVELDANGGIVGEEVKINRRSLDANQFLSIASDGKGSFLIPWEGYVARDPSISAQRPAQQP